MRVAAVIQARMGSTRLPGKILADLGGRPALGHVVERVLAARTPTDVVVALPCGAENDQVMALVQADKWFEWLPPSCDPLRVKTVQVSQRDEADVLGRYAVVAQVLGLAEDDLVVRVTADCPLLDPALLDAVVALAQAGGVEYASDVWPDRTYPYGLDVEAVSVHALRMVELMLRGYDTAPPDGRQAREHPAVAFWCLVPADRQRHLPPCPMPGLDGVRWTLDTAEDLAVLRRVVAGLPIMKDYSMAETWRAYNVVVQAALEGRRR